MTDTSPTRRRDAKLRRVSDRFLAHLDRETQRAHDLRSEVFSSKPDLAYYAKLEAGTYERVRYAFLQVLRSASHDLH